MSVMRTTVIYGFANGMAYGLPILMLPWLTRVLTAEDYGAWSLFTVFVSVMVPLIGINLNGAVARKYFEKERVHLPTYIANCVGLTTASALLFWILIQCASPWISPLMKLPPSWLWSVAAVAFGQSIVGIYLALLQARQESTRFAVTQIGQAICVLLLTLTLGAKLGYSWKTVVSAQIAGYLIFALVALVQLHRKGWIDWKWEPNYVRQALAFGIPLVPHAIGGIAIAMSDKVILANLVGLEASGLYEVGTQASAGMKLLTYSFIQAWYPKLFESLARKSESENRKTVRFTYLYSLGLLGLVLVTTWVGKLLIPLALGRSFQSSGQFIFWICLGYAFNGMYLMVVNYIFYVEKTYLLAGITAFAGILNIALNFVLIPINGPIGAAQASAIAFLAAFLITWFVSARVHPMPWKSFG